MGETGTYSEKLPCGGKLEVALEGFRIRYYFPGPDARSSGTFVDLDGVRLLDYIAAYKENWNEFRQLKASIPPGGEFQKPGKLGMQLRIGRFHEGVCIQAYHMPLATKEAIQAVIESYRYAIGRAERAMNMLREL